MKKTMMILLSMFILVGCQNKEKLYNHEVYMIENDYEANVSVYSKVDVDNSEYKKIKEVEINTFMLSTDNKSVYAIYKNRVVEVGEELKYITDEEEHVTRFVVKDGVVYYENFYDFIEIKSELLTTDKKKGLDQEQEGLLEKSGVSALLIDKDLFVKHVGKENAGRIFKYDLKNMGKETLVVPSLIFIVKDNYLYYVHAADKYIYKMNIDNMKEEKLTKEPLEIPTRVINQVNGYYSMDVVDDALYYVLDDNILYKETNKNKKAIVNDVYTFQIVDDTIYCQFKNENKTGISMFDKEGNLIKEITNKDIKEFVVKKK